MICHRLPVKVTAIFVIIAFIFRVEIFINAQREDEIERQFQVARAYDNKNQTSEVEIRVTVDNR